jgi:hypothetical protein
MGRVPTYGQVLPAGGQVLSASGQVASACVRIVNNAVNTTWAAERCGSPKRAVFKSRKRYDS